MRHEPILPAQTGKFNLSQFARDVVVSGIMGVADDKPEMKARIMQAYEHGHLTGEQVTALIASHGLKHT